MGFRTYIGKMSKDKAIKLKTMSREDIINTYGDEDNIEENYPPSPYELAEQLYELGAYVDEPETSFRLFDHDDANEHYNQDYLMVGITQEGFVNIIKGYQDKVSESYKRMYDSINIIGADKEEIENHLRGNLSEWASIDYGPLDFNMNSERITSSWKYEYAIFELMRIYKTFDFDNDVVVVYGW